MFKQYYDIVTLWRSNKIDLVSYGTYCTTPTQFAFFFHYNYLLLTELYLNEITLCTYNFFQVEDCKMAKINPIIIIIRHAPLYGHFG